MHEDCPDCDERRARVQRGAHAHWNDAARLRLQEKKGLTETRAYQAASMAADLRITELVDGNVGVYMMIAKSYMR